MKTLLTRKELADRWGISTSTLDRRIREGIISSCNSVGQPRFNLDDVLKVEGTDNSKMSPFERRKLERAVSQLEEKIERLEREKESINRHLASVMAAIIPVLQITDRSE